MGRFVNPNNSAFQNALNAEIYVEWNKSAATAINQIKEKRYAESLQNYAGEIFFVGINYDKKMKKHICSIEKLVN